MSEPVFRFASAPSALTGAPAGWAAEMLREGEVAQFGGEDLDGVSRLAHELGQPAILVLRREDSDEAQAQTVISWTANLPLVWVAPGFGDAVQTWARERGPMTLLVSADEPLTDEQRRTIDRFVASLGRQSE